MEEQTIVLNEVVMYFDIPEDNLTHNVRKSLVAHFPPSAFTGTASFF
jgi:hypothetical protein